MGAQLPESKSLAAQKEPDLGEWGRLRMQTYSANKAKCISNISNRSDVNNEVTYDFPDSNSTTLPSAKDVRSTFSADIPCIHSNSLIPQSKPCNVMIWGTIFQQLRGSLHEKFHPAMSSSRDGFHHYLIVKCKSVYMKGGVFKLITG